MIQWVGFGFGDGQNCPTWPREDPIGWPFLRTQKKLSKQNLQTKIFGPIIFFRKQNIFLTSKKIWVKKDFGLKKIGWKFVLSVLCC